MGTLYIGNQTACWAATPAEPFEYALAQGFDAFEWFPDKKPGAGWDTGDLDSRARQAIGETARARGMRLSVHARSEANPLTTDGCALLWQDLELACDLGAALLNIHLFHEQGLPAFVKAILPLTRRTADAGMQLSIENTPLHSPEQFNEVFVRLLTVDSVPISHVGMCLDLGHANLCSATRNDYLAFCDRLDTTVPVIHLHLHENWGESDSHLPLFTGPSARDDHGIRELLARLRRRDFSGSAILEQWPHPPSLLNQARDRLLKLWRSSAREPLPNPTPETPSVGQCPSPKATEQSAGYATTEAGMACPDVSGRAAFHASSLSYNPLSKPSDPAAELAAGDRHGRSWREKLDLILSLLEKDDPPLTCDRLIDVFIYLRFLGTGQIACAEDGRHFRPAHHARIASQIQARLAGLTTSDNEFIVRKIYAWLPSSAATFQRPEPLTRIRDIAHRNDIEPDLKREIKTTLQNKLHRCAGPEDLATSAALLERLTAPGTTYSPDFVAQFRIFHEELKEFFNARSLDERLGTLISSVDGTQADLIRLFRQQKAGHSRENQFATLRTLTALRESFRDVIVRKPALETQELRLADIALEDFAFVLLSEIINGCENNQSDPATEFQTEALVLALSNLALSGVERVESRALESEMRGWGALSPALNRDELLRLRASVLRCRRLAEDFGARVVALFAGRVERLGHALGVSEHAIHVFSESNIRDHIVFQVSKLASGLLRRIRERLGLPGWDVLVTGRAVGRVVSAASLDTWQRDAPEPAVVLLERAAGDEEIPRNVAAIVLAHEMPHLSHLGVRARQAGVVFVACDEPSASEGLRVFEGRLISLLALPDNVTWESAAELSSVVLGARSPTPQIPSVRLPAENPWIPLEQAVTETGGGKADGARRLAELSRQPGAGFLTPPALVIPFGVMEAALDAMPTVETEYRERVRRLDTLPPVEIPAATQRLRDLVQQLEVPQAIITQVRRMFAHHSALIVRSSANCEDLKELAGAGLYESVINVPPSGVAGAIRSVWSSLWTERATLSRRGAGLPHGQAHMAVLVQELIDPDYSFVLHTVNPITHNPSEVYAEIVVGLGETLASAATRGSPYRLVCDKQSGAIVTLAFANFSQASHPSPEGGLRRETVDYSRIDLSFDAGARNGLAQRLSAIGSFVEHALGKPQDIEGAVVKGQIYLVQARSQPGLTSTKKP